MAFVTASENTQSDEKVTGFEAITKTLLELQQQQQQHQQQMQQQQQQQHQQLQQHQEDMMKIFQLQQKQDMKELREELKAEIQNQLSENERKLSKRTEQQIISLQTDLLHSQIRLSEKTLKVSCLFNYYLFDYIYPTHTK